MPALHGRAQGLDEGPSRLFVLALALIAIVAVAPLARAQSAAAVSVGLSVSTFDPRGDLVLGAAGIGPVLRLKTDPGLNAAIGFSWFGVTAQTEIQGQPRTVGTLRVRPVMAGAGYTLRRDPYAITFSAVAGYAFTSIKVNALTRAAWQDSVGASRASIDAGNAFAWRAQVSFWYDVAPRIGLMASLSYVGVHPSVTLQSDRGRETRSLRADPVVVSFGVAYGVF